MPAHRVLDTRRRFRAGIVYLVLAAIAAGLVVASGVSAMWLTAVVPLVVLGGLQIVGSWKMAITDMEAIRIAGESTSFPVGHGSATLGYHGVLAKPVWQVLVYANTPSPDHQAVVTVDAITGNVTGRYEESVEPP
jgi:hypothetical protein